MKRFMFSAFVLIVVGMLGCNGASAPEGTSSKEAFPAELVSFSPYKQNPVFAGTDTTTWDRLIRERGFILREDSGYHLWYTGYVAHDSVKHLGYATSADGLHWTRYPGNPIDSTHWIEDVFVIKKDAVYYLFAEGVNDVAHLFTSIDKIHWERQGELTILKKDGTPIEKGAYGTPTAWYEDGLWYLFYERGDLGIWLATSKDLKTWRNVQDEPVIPIGPEAYDKYAVAMNQVIKYKGLYYGYYHASGWEDWREWSTNIAVSKDLVHWEKYQGNPIWKDNTSSGIVVDDGAGYRLYTMHPAVNVFLPATAKP